MYTLPTAEILSGKNERAWVPMVLYLTLKAAGFFGPVDLRGGAAARHFGERSLNPPHFHVRPTNSISYES